MNYVKQRHLEFVNKPGKWLPYKLRKRKANGTETSSDNVLMDNAAMQRAFHQYYSNLYRKTCYSFQEKR